MVINLSIFPSSIFQGGRVGADGGRGGGGVGQEEEGGVGGKEGCCQMIKLNVGTFLILRGGLACIIYIYIYWYHS